MAASSKIKSHIRKTKSGTTRVKESKRKSIGKKIAIAGAVGLAGAYALKKNRDFKDSKLLVDLAKQKIKNPKRMNNPTKKFEFLVSSKTRKELLDSARKLKSANPFLGKIGKEASKTKKEFKAMIFDVDKLNQGY